MGITEKVDPAIWVTRVALDDYDVRGALILGKDIAVVWDTLSHPRDMRPFLPLIANRELVIVYSHADWDHIWGTAGLGSASTRIVAHELCRRRFDADVPVTLDRETAGITRRLGRRGARRRRRRRSRTSWSLDLGGMTLLLRHLPGHTPDSIVGFIPERGILLAGDTVETPCPVVPADSPLQDWIAELGRWAGRRTRAPGDTGARRHGRTEIVQQNVEYLEAIRTGSPREPAVTLTAFYRDTHLQNVRWQALMPTADRREVSAR